MLWTPRALKAFIALVKLIWPIKCFLDYSLAHVCSSFAHFPNILPHTEFAGLHVCFIIFSSHLVGLVFMFVAVFLLLSILEFSLIRWECKLIFSGRLSLSVFQSAFPQDFQGCNRLFDVFLELLIPPGVLHNLGFVNTDLPD